jgi:large subunit ribosomal protein L13
MMIVVDGEGCVLGRMGAKVAKELLNGEKVALVNADKVVIVGDPDFILKDYTAKFSIRDIAKPVKSPKLSRRPDLFVKRTIRGMLPIRRKRGAEAHRRLMAYVGVPKEFEGKGKKICELDDKTKKFITVGELCRRIGWKG